MDLLVNPRQINQIHRQTHPERERQIAYLGRGQVARWGYGALYVGNTSAADLQSRGIDIASVRGTEKEHGIGDIFSLHLSLQNLDVLAYVFEPVVPFLVHYEARPDGVDPDVLRPTHAGGDAGKALEPGLGRGVARDIETAANLQHLLGEARPGGAG